MTKKKTIGLLNNIFHYCFLNIIVNINSASDPNITVNTTLKYCRKQFLNNKIKLVGGAKKIFSEKLLGHEIFNSMVPWVRYLF